MITSQKLQFLRSILILCPLLFSLSIMGQNFISNLKQDGIKVEKLVIKITKPKKQSAEIEIRITSPMESGSILEVPKGAEVFITSLNGNIGQIKGPNIVEFTATSTGEEYRVIDGSGSNNVFITVLKKLTGGVLASGPTGEIHARSRLTEFLVTAEGDVTQFELIKGQIDLNSRQRIEIADENKIDSIKKRPLFVTETKILNLKDPTFDYNADSVKVKSLTTDNTIKRFFDEQLGVQRRMFTKAGPKSKKSFKFLNNGLDENGKDLLIEAYEDGELRADFIIQSSLMLADIYFKKDDLKRCKSWLGVGLHFSELYYKANKDKYDHFSKIGNNKITKAFGNDLVVANEYNFWAYTLKSRINGCLESESENPLSYRRQANMLKKEISKY